MKFIIFADMWTEDMTNYHNLAVARLKEWIQELKENPEKSERYMRLQDGTPCSFIMIPEKFCVLYEADNEDQLRNFANFWRTQGGKYEKPLLKNMRYIPIQQTRSAS